MRPARFTADGWFKTGDAVEVDGEYFRILGGNPSSSTSGREGLSRRGGERPSGDGSVEDASVKGESNPITGQIVAARVKLRTNETVSEFATGCSHTAVRTAALKIPQKVFLVSENTMRPLQEDAIANPTTPLRDEIMSSVRSGVDGNDPAGSGPWCGRRCGPCGRRLLGKALSSPRSLPPSVRGSC